MVDTQKVLDYFGFETPSDCWFYPMPLTTPAGRLQISPEEVVTLQYWPSTINDDYQTDWSEKPIPGGSHPLYQWVGGRGRVITFTAVFTAEVAGNMDPNQPLENTTTTLAKDSRARDVVSPSARFTVDVAAALAKIRQYQMGHYPKGGPLGLVEAPKRLRLTIPGTHLGGVNNHSVNVILRSAPVTIKSWYPNGQVRVASVDLQFNEIVQKGGGAGTASQIEFIDRSVFSRHGKFYKKQPAQSITRI